jgi:hypothetical protein
MPLLFLAAAGTAVRAGLVMAFRIVAAAGFLASLAVSRFHFGFGFCICVALIVWRFSGRHGLPLLESTWGSSRQEDCAENPDAPPATTSGAGFQPA